MARNSLSFIQRENIISDYWILNFPDQLPGQLSDAGPWPLIN